MRCKQLFETVDSLYDQYVTFWQDVCNIESPTSDKAGVDAVGDYFIREARERGWKIERCAQASAGDVVVITLNPEADNAPVILSGHMDTVHPKGLFGYPPVRIEGDKIYGPGVTDCKGGIVAGFMAMDALERCGFTSRPVTLMLQSDEEGGSRVSGKATIEYMCKRAQGAAAFLNLEPYSRGKVCVARKGIITFKFTVTGIEAHSSLCARTGANAIADAAHKIIELEKLKDDGGLTCNCGVIQGGSVPNTVAGSCEFLANVRFVNSQQLEWIKDYAQKLADTVHVPGCSCKLEVYGSRLAMEYSERNLILADTVNRIFTENGLQPLEAVRYHGGSDAAEMTSSGVTCLDSLGTEGDYIHSADEFGLLASLPESAKRMAAVAYCI
ncbi:MAG: M20/M25/M40 family metallo-hydrolase [Clostridia bacterium]|nr:M20/M25/M40 family metallo-hydrolase [Clostridia bacterium]